MKPKIVIDNAIPYIRGVFDKVADVAYLPASNIDNCAVKDADALIVRTRTKCNAALLDGSAVRHIFTATIGYDHIDTAYCASHGIVWQNAPGCNASAVAQYVGSALSLLPMLKNENLIGKTIGIVGHGHVGKQVEKIAKMLGMKVLLNDPPLSDSGIPGYCSFDEIAANADVITFHTPLTFTGWYATYHLLDAYNVAKLRRKPLIINAARGGVVNEQVLLAALDMGIVSACVIDCWENEPRINRELLAEALIGTPHIAGYSADGKFNATRMAIDAVAEWFNLRPDEGDALPPRQIVRATVESLPQILLSSYPICDDSERLKSDPECFEAFRNRYNYRREIAISCAL